MTIGAYDGVHLGHRAVIDRVRKLAADRGVASALVTFDQHPARLVRPESAPLLLTDPEQKLELLEATGLDTLLVVRFDEERAQETPEDFVTEVLVDCLKAKAVVVGKDFHFGHQRRGNVALLAEMGEEAGFEVEGIELMGSDARPADAAAQVSSTAIRQALAAGDVERAASLLGRDHEVRGIVTHGDERATELGFPTANVSVPNDVLLPADGIYAGWYTRPDGSRHPAAISLGRRPTFYETAHASLLEAHLLDSTDVDLYDERARVAFACRLRDEVRFDTVEALIEQMHRDCAEARQRLGS